MKLVWKPLEDLRLMFGRKFIKNVDRNVKFVKVDAPIFLTANGNAGVAESAKFESSDELVNYINNQYITHFYYYLHEFRNVIDANGQNKTWLVVRFHTE